MLFHLIVIEVRDAGADVVGWTKKWSANRQTDTSNLPSM